MTTKSALVVALKPNCDAVGIERVTAATYQAVSGAGRKRSAVAALIVGRGVWLADAGIAAPGPQRPGAFNGVA